MSSLRPACIDDAPAILAMIRELAEYEKLSHEMTATEAQLRDTLFGPRPFAEALLAEVDSTPAGFAVYFHSYSTFVAKPGMYLEDLFVKPSFRGRGVGKALLVHVARIAAERGCGRYEWSVLDWNTPSIRFYESLGATLHTDWRRMRVEGPALATLASKI